MGVIGSTPAQVSASPAESSAVASLFRGGTAIRCMAEVQTVANAPVRDCVTIGVIHSERERLLSASTGMEMTLGVCHAVETWTAPKPNLRVCVRIALTTATTLPSQSSTGAPEAP